MTSPHTHTLLSLRKDLHSVLLIRKWFMWLIFQVSSAVPVCPSTVCRPLLLVTSFRRKAFVFGSQFEDTVWARRSHAAESWGCCLHHTYGQEAGSNGSWWSAHFPFLFSGDPSHRMMPPALPVSLHTSVYKGTPGRHAQMFISMVTLDPIKVIVQIKHQWHLNMFRFF